IELNEHEINQRKLNGTYERYLKQETLRVIYPYFVLSGISLIWAIIIGFVKFPTLQTTKQATVTTNSEESNNTNNKKLCRPYFFLSVLAQFISAYLMQHWIKAQLLMGIYSIINMVLLAIAILARGWVGLISLFCTSFFMSLMFPTIFALGLKDLGEKQTKLAGSLLVMAIVGGAVLTPFMGFMSELIKSLAVAYFVPLLAYGFVALFSFINLLKIN
ncbi:unnamed protein product, partial [Didymodactylos carnosus]